MPSPTPMSGCVSYTCNGRLDGLGLRTLLDKVDMPLVPVLLAMELAGVKIDAAFLGGMSQRFEVRLQEIEEEVYQRPAMNSI
jgi:DNA polymerase-1